MPQNTRVAHALIAKCLLWKGFCLFITIGIGVIISLHWIDVMSVQETGSSKRTKRRIAKFGNAKVSIGRYCEHIFSVYLRCSKYSNRDCIAGWIMVCPPKRIIPYHTAVQPAVSRICSQQTIWRYAIQFQSVGGLICEICVFPDLPIICNVKPFSCAGIRIVRPGIER